MNGAYRATVWCSVDVAIGARRALCAATRRGQGAAVPERRLCAAVSADAVGQRRASRVCRIRSTSGAREPNHLPKDAPNILIILLDDVGFGQADTFGGEIHTPTLTRLASQGISYNAFHTTAICSPTRAALLTGRNHHRVGTGTIAERAVDWDGYTGVIPKTSATVAEGAALLRLQDAPPSASGTTRRRPRRRRWARSTAGRPAGIGFDYFYGFLAGETSQWEPRLVENTNPIEPPARREVSSERGPGGQGDRLAAQASRVRAGQAVLHVLGARRGARSAPHLQGVGRQVQGQVRRRLGCLCASASSRARRSSAGFPPNTKLTPRADTHAGVGQHSRRRSVPFQLRLMEIYAGFVEHVDTQAGKLIDELERQGIRDNTIVIYIFGDNGASAEGQNGTHQRAAGAERHPQHGRAADRGAEQDWRPRCARRPEDRQHVSRRLGVGRRHAVPAHEAGRFALRRHAQSDGRSRGRRASRPDKTPRSQFHHVNDIVPTIYEVLGIKPPKVVDGFAQDPIDGVSLAYTFADAEGTRRASTCSTSRTTAAAAIYQDGWSPATFGPLVPWDCAGAPETGRVGLGQGRVGALQPHDGLLAGRRPGRRRIRSGWRR